MEKLEQARARAQELTARWWHAGCEYISVPGHVLWLSKGGWAGLGWAGLGWAGLGWAGLVGVIYSSPHVVMILLRCTRDGSCYFLDVDYLSRQSRQDQEQEQAAGIKQGATAAAAAAAAAGTGYVDGGVVRFQLPSSRGVRAVTAGR